MKPLYISNILIISLIGFSFLSCEKEANVKVPKVDSKIVVQSYISPQDTLIVVHVENSSPIFNRRNFEGMFNPEDAVVNLSDGTNSINLDFLEDPSGFGGWFAADPKRFPIIAGTTYYLTVTTADGKKAESSCTVPGAAPTINNFKLDSTVVNRTNFDGYVENYTSYQISLSFNDIQGQQNFYKFAGYKISNYYFGNEVDEVYTQIDPLYFPNDVLFNDHLIDGDQISISKMEIFSEHHGWDNLIGPVTGEISLLSTDKHYYEYHRTIQETDDDNPFAEPILTYSNVKGGLGVFCAYNRNSVPFSF